ncbi:MAG: CapA family protein [Rhodobacteraceae bacterium]|nr:CapA family protein [Paracoccaceae bacterium]
MTALSSDSRSDPPSATPAAASGDQPAAVLLPRPRRTGPRLDLLFLGDIDFGETYQAVRADKGEENVLTSRGYDDALANLRGLVSVADFAIANLETPVTGLAMPENSAEAHYQHRADPALAPLHLARNRVSAVSIANNHVLDCGIAGLEDTLRSLDAEGIHRFGAGRNADEAGRPLILELGGGTRPLRLAVFTGYAARPDSPALEPGDGVRPSSLDPADVAARLATLRAKYPDLLAVAFPHWGPNYGWRSVRQRELAKGLLDAGIDLILGHGAHCLQEIHRRSGRWVVYGLGNFVFNSPGRYRRMKSPPFSLAARLVARPRPDGWLVTLRLYPIVSDNRITDYRPRFTTEDEFDQVREMLVARSRGAPIGEGRDRHGRYLKLRVQRPPKADAGAVTPEAVGTARPNAAPA